MYVGLVSGTGHNQKVGIGDDPGGWDVVAKI